MKFEKKKGTEALILLNTIMQSGNTFFMTCYGAKLVIKLLKTYIWLFQKKLFSDLKKKIEFQNQKSC